MSELTVNVKSDLTRSTGRGFEGIDKSDLLIPRAKLLQPLSPEVVEEQLANAKAGQIRNSLTKELLPSRVVPIFCFKTWMRFNSRDSKAEGFHAAYAPGGLIWRSTNPSDPKVIEEAGFGPNGEVPLALTFLNFFSFFPSVSMPIILSFSKTSYKTGKQLLSLARFCGGDMWSRAYQLGATLQTNEKGSYYVFSVTTLGESTAEERTHTEAWWKTFSDQATNLKIHEEESPETMEV